ncbi:hypothetical protein [Actinomadura gamaensis]|uniref:Uncharacterized protein n=1 Tax=Actinomadura gamaensis TaxID=1763541 RepID=A0ABV9UB87_9ACTN
MSPTSPRPAQDPARPGPAGAAARTERERAAGTADVTATNTGTPETDPGVRVAGRPPETDPNTPDTAPIVAGHPHGGDDGGATRSPEPRPDGSVESRLLADAEAGRFRERWHEVQAGFVDDPEESVRKADELTAEVVNAIGQALTSRKHELDERWRNEKDAPSDTERLRQALRGYRTLVDRMLGA